MDDVGQAAGAVAPYLTKMIEPRGQEIILKDLGSYRAQFAGIIRNGNRLIAANYFCRGTNDDRISKTWQSHWVVVFDGGPCYFHFIFDPKGRSIREFVINGYG
jgi:hypothetical protein